MKTTLFITKHDLRHSFFSDKIWLYGIIAFTLSFLIVNIFGGAFDFIKIMIAGENVKLNSANMLAIQFSFLNLIGAAMLAIFSGRSALKDLDYNTIPVHYSLPVTKSNYLGGRIMALLINAAFLFLCFVSGLMVGSFMPYLDASQFGPFNIFNYLYPFLIIILPNVFFVSAMLFSLSFRLRNYFSVWMGLILLFGLYYAAIQLNKKIELTWLAGLLDPFGIVARGNSKIGLTESQLNTLYIIDKGILLNRMLWCSIGCVSLLLTYTRFNFLQVGFKRLRTKKAFTIPDSANKPHNISPSLRSVYIGYTFADNLKKLFFLIRTEIQLLLTNRYFNIILLIGIGIVIASAMGIGKIYNTKIYPVTYHVCEVFIAATRLFLFALITLFSGEMVWRDRNTKTWQLNDTLPVSSGLKFSSKLLALGFVVLVFHFLLIATGLLVQHTTGHERYEFSLYLKLCLGFGFINQLILLLLAFTIQNSVKNKFIGYFIMMIYYLLNALLFNALFEDNTFRFNSFSEISYSDLSQFGYNIPVYILFRFYWFSFVTALVLLSVSLYPANADLSMKVRLSYLKERFKSLKFRLLIGTLTGSVILSGGYIFYNIHFLNDYKTIQETEQQMVNYEKKYAAYKPLAQPVPVSVNVYADLYPENGSLLINGSCWLKNWSSQSISQICIDPGATDSIWLNTPNKRLLADEDFQVLGLNHSLAPGDSVQLHFKLFKTIKGFGNNGIESLILPNGTFINSDLFPGVGYNENHELTSNKSRRKYGLPEKKRFAKSMNDKEGLAVNMLNQQSLVHLNIIAGTCKGQRIMAPGKLIRNWTSHNRQYFQFESKRPINNFYAILSGNYQVIEEQWNSPDSSTVSANIGIYYHSEHKYNLSNMLNGMKEALNYYHTHFSPFQYPSLHITEFPRFATFAQSFPGCIPFSEDIGFLADLRNVNIDSASVMDEEVTIDYPFYVTAHEVAHQWWAHQVCPANVEGASFIVETLSQYSALMVMKQHYGPQKMRKFLNYESFQYLMARSGGIHTENTLMNVAPDEQSVFYRKGSVVMYALQDYIGEETVNTVLRRFTEKYAFKNAPYPTSGELIREFENVTPDSLKYIIHDWFKAITVYKNEALKASYRKTDDLEYIVNFDTDIHKYEYDSAGNEKEVAVNDYVEIGIYNAKGKEIFLEKLKMKKGTNHFTLKLGRKPEMLVVDPYNKLIDKNWLVKKTTVKSSGS